MTNPAMANLGPAMELNPNWRANIEWAGAAKSSIAFGSNTVVLEAAADDVEYLCSAALLCMGDTSAVANRFEAQTRRAGGIAINVLAAGETSRLSDNVMAERLGAVRRWSAFVVGASMGTGVGNQSTHCLEIVGPPGRVARVGNLALHCEAMHENDAVLREVHGVVYANGSPVAGATVSVEGTQRKATTNQKGQFVLRDLPATTLRLRATRSGFPSATLEVAPNEDSVRIDLA